MSSRSTGWALSLTVHALVIAGLVNWNHSDSALQQKPGSQTVKLSVSMFEAPEPQNSQSKAQPVADKLVALNNKSTTAAHHSPHDKAAADTTAKPRPTPTPTPTPTPIVKLDSDKSDGKIKLRPEAQKSKATAQTPSVAPSAQRAGIGRAAETKKGVENAYKKKLQQAILKKRHYPRQAKRKHAEGTVSVFLRLDRSGVIRALRVQQSSGSKLLDKAALEAVQKVGQFPPFPPNIDRQTWEFEFPVTFKLN